MTVQLACGHVGQVPDNWLGEVGDWVSCWALMHPEQGCQTQRKVIEVTR